MGRLSANQMYEQIRMAESRIAEKEPLVVFDLETTGISPLNDQVLSVSAIKVVWDNGFPDETDRLDLFLDPGRHIPEGATEVNGITDEDVRGCPTEKGGFARIHAFFGDHPFLCGYNSTRFDELFMKGMYGRNGCLFEPALHIDVLDMAKEKLDMPRYRLQMVAHELGADAGLTFHRSLDDVYATFRIFSLLRHEYREEPREEKQNHYKVIQCHYWRGQSHYLQRLYIQTMPPSKIYFDLYRREWRSENDNDDLPGVRQDVLAGFGVRDEAALIRKVNELVRKKKGEKEP